MCCVSVDSTKSNGLNHKMSANKYHGFFLSILNALYRYCPMYRSECLFSRIGKIIIIKRFNDLFLYTHAHTAEAEHLNCMQIMNSKSRSTSVPFKLQPFRGIIIITKSLLIEGLL